ncbi:hypothetical protein CMMCAS04_05555 [Clavibacter michiganensis subsp. michiganensis]|nr:hypothetical protein CMMCAS04_05555 [Clavibacter michiganensis subsp. michiganensis]
MRHRVGGEPVGGGRGRRCQHGGPVVPVVRLDGHVHAASTARPVDHERHRAPHAGGSRVGGLDLAELHPVPAELHLPVRAAEELEDPARPVPAGVARAVPAAAAELDERGRRARRIAPVAAREAAAPDDELARDPVGAVPAGGVEDAERLVGQRPAVGRGLPAVERAVHLPRVRPDGRLGGAAQRDEPRARPGRADQAPVQVGAHAVAGDERRPQRAEPPRPVVGRDEEHVEQQRHRVPQRDPVLVHQVEPARGVALLALLGEHERAARTEDAEHVEHGEVEVERGQGEDPVARADLQHPGHRVDRGPRGVVRDLDALGLARGTGGVDDVGERLDGRARRIGERLLRGRVGPVRGVAVRAALLVQVGDDLLDLAQVVPPRDELPEVRGRRRVGAPPRLAAHRSLDAAEDHGEGDVLRLRGRGRRVLAEGVAVVAALTLDTEELVRERAADLHGAADLVAVGGEPSRDEAGSVLREAPARHERCHELSPHALGGVHCLVVGDDPPAFGRLLGLLLLRHGARDRARGGRGGLVAAVADGLGVAEVVHRLRVAQVRDHAHAAPVEGVHLLRGQERVTAVRGHQIADGHEPGVLRVLGIHDHVAAALVVRDCGLDRLLPGHLVLREPQLVGEPPGVRSHGLDEASLDLGEIVELDERGGLVEGQLVVGERRGRGGRVRDRERLLDGPRPGARALGDRRGAQALELQLLERDRALRVRERQALVVLDELLHDPLGGGLVPLDDVNGHRRQTDLSRGKGAALSGPDKHTALAVAASTDRREDAIRLDALYELPVEVRAGAHVLLEDERVRVQVLDDPGGTGGVLGNRHVCSLFHSFFCREGVFTP